MRNRFNGWLKRPLRDRGLVTYLAYRLRWALLALVALFWIATFGYVFITHYGWIDAAFMTVITLSTVGYDEVHPLHSAGRIFTIGIIIASFGTLVYAASKATEIFSSGAVADHLRQSRGRRMRELLTEHVIVVGFGRVGQAVAAAVHELGHSCLVLDRDPGLHDPIQTAGHVPMTGDATDEEALEEAGIHRAAALIAAAEHDNVNLIITLTARAVRPGLRIISRVNEAAWRDRIVRAGADIAQSPYPSYGMSLATCALTPGVLDVHGLPTLGLGTEEIEVSKGSPFVGRSLVEIDSAHSGVFIAGLRRDAQLRRWDDVDGPIVPGDVVVALGTPEFLRELAQHSQGNWTT